MKRAAAAVCAAILILLSCSCSAEDPLVGRWRTRFSSEEAGGTVELIYDFHADGTLTVGSAGDNAFSLPFGTYEISGGELVIRSGDGAERYGFTVAGDTLTLRQNGRETSFTRAAE